MFVKVEDGTYRSEGVSCLSRCVVCDEPIEYMRPSSDSANHHCDPKAERRRAILSRPRTVTQRLDEGFTMISLSGDDE